MKKIRNKRCFLPAFVILGVLSLFIISNKSGAPANAHAQMENNTAEPKPKQVKMLLESLGLHLKSGDERQADTDANNSDVTSP